MSNRKKIKILKVILLIIAIGLIVGITMKMIPIIKELLTENRKN